MRRLLELGKAPYVVTFPWLEAYGYYLRNGFEKVMDYGEFVALRYVVP